MSKSEGSKSTQYSLIMKLLNIFIVLLWSCLSLQATTIDQVGAIDSLSERLLTYSKKDTTRVNLLTELALLNYKEDLDKSLLYIEESATISDSLNFKKGSARSLYVKGVVYASQFNFDQAFEFFDESLRLNEMMGFENGIAECLRYIGGIFDDKGDYEQAISYYNRSIEVYEKIGSDSVVAKILIMIGNSYIDIGSYSEAITCYKRALSMNESLGNEIGVSTSLNDIGNVYNEQGNHPLALEYYNKSLVIDEGRGDTIRISKTLNNIGVIYKNTQNYDKALVYYQKALSLQKAIGNKSLEAELLNNLGLLYKKKKDFNAALECLQGALELGRQIKNKYYIGIIMNNIGGVFMDLENSERAYINYQEAHRNNEEIGNQRGLCNTYLGLAKVSVSRDNYADALKYAKKSREISEKLELLGYQNEVLELLANIYERTGKYEKAFTSHRQFKILNDSLFNKENIEKITQLEYDYQYKNALDSANLRELNLTKKVETTTEDLAKSQRNYLLAIIGFLLIFGLLGCFIFYLKFRNVNSENQNIIIEQKLLRSQMTPHFIFNSLAVLQGMILNKEHKTSLTYLSKLSKLLRIVLENSRDKLVPLSKELLAIENYLTLLNLETGNPYDYSIKIDDEMDVEQILVPPMLIQPFVENAIEHAFRDSKYERKIDVQVKYIGDDLVCYITDNGMGIDAQEHSTAKNKSSLAITITKERLKILSSSIKAKGAINIEDMRNFGKQGTKVTLTLPHKYIPQ